MMSGNISKLSSFDNLQFLDFNHLYFQTKFKILKNTIGILNLIKTILNSKSQNQFLYTISKI